MEESKAIKAKIGEQELEAKELDKQRDAKLTLIGNIVGDDVPVF